MSGTDRIWAYEINYPISKVHGEKRWVPWEPKPITLQMREGFFGRKTRQIPQVFHEYIRRDPAVIAALPEVQALIAEAYEAAAREIDVSGDPAVTEALGQQLCCSGHMCGCQGADVGTYLLHIIRALTPAAALAARDAMIAEAVAKERARIIAALREEADVLPCCEDAKVTEGCADLIEADFSYDEAERIAAIRKRGEIPASNKTAGEQQ